MTLKRWTHPLAVTLGAMLLSVLGGLVMWTVDARAQQVVTQSPGVVNAFGTLTATGDTVTLPINGAQWATVKFLVNTGGTTTVVAEISLDGGNNYTSPPFGKRITHISANPQIAPVAGAVNAGDVWETPLPSNTTHYRLRANPGGTATTVTIQPGQVYVPGTPVIAVLYDTTTGTNTALDTGTLEVSGWIGLEHLLTMNGGVPAFSTQHVDDAGVSSANLLTWATASWGGWGSTLNAGGGSTAGLASTQNVPLPRRVRYQSAPIVGQTSRIRIEARR